MMIPQWQLVTLASIGFFTFLYFGVYNILMFSMGKYKDRGGYKLYIAKIQSGGILIATVVIIGILLEWIYN